MSEPVIAGKKSHIVEVEAGKEYYWCACGRSASQPFCDGSHKGTDFEPLLFVPEKSKKIPFCDCKHTGKPPICDGKHKSL